MGIACGKGDGSLAVCLEGAGPIFSFSVAGNLFIRSHLPFEPGKGSQQHATVLLLFESSRREKWATNTQDPCGSLLACCET